MKNIDDFIINEIMLVITNLSIKEIILQVDKKKYGMENMTDEEIQMYIKNNCDYCDMCNQLFYKEDLVDSMEGSMICGHCDEQIEDYLKQE